MSFLNQASAQIASLFRSMSAGARVVAGLLLAVIIVSLAYLFNHRISAPDAYLMGGEPIAADEINRIVGALGKAGLKNFAADGDRIRVPRGEEATYMAALVDEGALPGNYGSYLQKAVSDGGMLVPKSMQLQRKQVAMQFELQNVIRKMKGIKSALVLYDVREERGLKREPQFSASVSVSTHVGNPLDDARVKQIRHLVASAIGMPPESVTVTDLESGFTFPATKPGQGGPTDAYAQSMISYEKHWTEKIRQGLSYIPGVVVACNVELNDQIEHEEHRTVHDPKTVTISVKEETKTLNSKPSQPASQSETGGQGGAKPNQPAVARPIGGGGAQIDEETSRRDEKSVTSGSEQRTKTAPLTPNRVTAAIGVPSSYIEQVWQERNPTEPGQAPKKPPRADLKSIEEAQIKEIQEKVATLIPRPKEAAPNPMQQVHVTVFEKPAADSIPEPGVGDHALTWLGTHWRTLGTGLLGLLSLVMLRSMVRAAPPAERLSSALAAAGEQGANIETTAAEPRPTAASRLKRREKRDAPLREELVEIVREDPEAAASVLRSWINSSN